MASARDGSGQPETTDELRSDIDGGRTGDKVAHDDPAAAPLGTDAEAGGQPPTRSEVKRAQPSITTAPRSRFADDRSLQTLVVVGFVVVLLLVFGLVYAGVTRLI